jgi:formylglycine-generating enzyme required for sulfatase activity
MRGRKWSRPQRAIRETIRNMGPALRHGGVHNAEILDGSRAANRGRFDDDDRNDIIGFRVARIDFTP